MNKEELITISRGILNSTTTKDEIRHAKSLSDFFLNFTLNNNKSFYQKEYTETIIPGGVALSTSEAATCIYDYLRTIRFIKGIYLAINELYNRFPDQKINILYAGCGPYATLLLPLLPLFDHNTIQIILLDINAPSIEIVKKIVTVLRLEKYVQAFIQADAIKYKQPRSQPLHLIIAEAMHHALIREPQVAITTNLAPQLTKNGVFIPEEISLDLAFTFFSEEAYLQKANNESGILKKKSDKKFKCYNLDTLFSINKESTFSNKIIGNSSRFESIFYEVPKVFDDYPDLCITTKIVVFKHILLLPTESFITNPYCVASLFNMTNSTHFKLFYDFGAIPTWTYQLKG